MKVAWQITRYTGLPPRVNNENNPGYTGQRDDTDGRILYRRSLAGQQLN